MAPAEQSDHALIQRAQQHDADAVAELYHRYSGQIYRFCLFRVGDEASAQDLAEDVFLNMVEALPKYVDRGLPFGAWLFRIAHRRVVDHYRRKGRHPMDQLRESLPDSQPGPEVVAAQHSETLRLNQAMAQLSYDYRLVLQLRFVEGFDLDQAALTMQKSVGATKIMQHRALRQLAVLLVQ
jgi:RNA polymerase sigma-70 factor, ECF subfamily